MRRHRLSSQLQEWVVSEYIGQGLENNLHKSFPDNFLTKELKAIENEWGFDLEEYMKKYKGKKLYQKEH